MEGWISLYKKFISWEWYSDVNTKSVFIHCLLKANFSDNNWRGILIKRGQFFTSINHLSYEVNLTTKQIRVSLNKLKNTGEIKTDGASNGTMITVCKYDCYQNEKKSKGKPIDIQRANGGQTEGKQRATTNKENKENKENTYRKFDHLKLSNIEFQTLNKKYTKLQIDEILDSIENYKKNTNYKSLYLTSLKWLKKEYVENKPKMPF